MTEQNKTYTKNPISEVVCIIKISENTSISKNTASNIQLLLKDTYDDEIETYSHLIRFETKTENNSTETVAEHNNEFYVLRSLSGDKYLSLKPNHITIQKSKPYEGWTSDLLPLIVNSYNALTIALEHYPIIHFISIRYTNDIRIESKTGLINLYEYFNIFPQEPPGFPEHVIGYNSRTVFDCGDGSILNFHFYISPQTYSKRDALYMRADIDVQLPLAEREEISVEKLSEMASNLHDKALQSFESFIKDKYREEIH